MNKRFNWCCELLTWVTHLKLHNTTLHMAIQTIYLSIVPESKRKSIALCLVNLSRDTLLSGVPPPLTSLVKFNE